MNSWRVSVILYHYTFIALYCTGCCFVIYYLMQVQHELAAVTETILKSLQNYIMMFIQAYAACRRPINRRKDEMHVTCQNRCQIKISTHSNHDSKDVSYTSVTIPQPTAVDCYRAETSKNRKASQRPFQNIKKHQNRPNNKKVTAF